MSKRRQSPISVTIDQRKQLQDAKERFEAAKGASSDWGSFLTGVTLLGLTVLGAYALGKVAEQRQASISVVCGKCGEEFLMVLPHGAGAGVYQTTCPNPDCAVELVVDVGQP